MTMAWTVVSISMVILLILATATPPPMELRSVATASTLTVTWFRALLKQPETTMTTSAITMDADLPTPLVAAVSTIACFVVT